MKKIKTAERDIAARIVRSCRGPMVFRHEAAEAMDTADVLEAVLDEYREWCPCGDCGEDRVPIMLHLAARAGEDPEVYAEQVQRIVARLEEHFDGSV